MKCIRCDHDSKYKERPNRRCPKCGGEFAFEPHSGDPCTDGLFQAAIHRVSSNGQLRFGVENLYYELARRLKKKANAAGCFWILAVIGLVAGAVNFFKTRSNPGLALLFFGIALGLALLGWTWKPMRIGLEQEKFNQLWERWVKVHGQPDTAIRRAEPRGKPVKARAVEPDLGDYSFDRAVICDRARTVDLLLANNFHFENNCAVLSIGGYPEGPFQTVRAMLKRNPRLRVFALHDVTAVGCRLAYKLSTDPEWFQGMNNVTDVGLRPSQVQPFAGLFQPGEAVSPGHGLSPAEARWLAKYTLELAAIRPEQVLKRLFRAINQKEKAQERESRDEMWDTDFDFDHTSFSSEAGDTDGGGDSFG
jgi:hypothetical protein